MVNMIMRGCNGRMGQVITGIVSEMDDIQIVAGIDLFDEGKNAYPVYKSLDEYKGEADVLVDFAGVKDFEEMLTEAVSRKLPLVLCTTGYSEEQLQLIKEASEKTAILRSANMSLGINMLIRLLKSVSGVLSESGFDIEIVEKHHNKKLDAPSGTAIALADAINESLEEPYEYRYERASVREQRPKKEIGISAVRGGSIVGEHEIIFAGLDEVIELKHTAYSRAIFGKGAVAAAKFLAGKPAGMYDMQDVIA